MSKNAAASCDDCYFRRAGLCALVLAEPCPTFRQFSRAGLEPPRHPTLVPRGAALQVSSPVYAA